MPVLATDQANAAEIRAQRRWLALFATWGIMGLWHGAAWTFLFWGLYHALFIAAYRVSGPIRLSLSWRVRLIGGWILTLGLSMLAWIPFRADNLEHALALYGRLFDVQHLTHLGMRENVYLVALLMLLAVTLAGLTWRGWPSFKGSFKPAAQLIDTVAIATVVCLVFIFLRPVEQFIYFQF